MSARRCGNCEHWWQPVHGIGQCFETGHSTRSIDGDQCEGFERREATDEAGEARLSCYDADEWCDVARRVNPAISQQQFERDWSEFQRIKAERAKRQTCS